MSNITWSNGALITGDVYYMKASDGIEDKKRYYEITVLSTTSSANLVIGICGSDYDLTNSPYADSRVRFYGGIGDKGMPRSAYGATYAVNDVISVLVDFESNTVEFWKNGVSQGVAFSDISALTKPVYSLVSSGGGSLHSYQANFGSSPFVYEVPEGYIPYSTILHKRLIIKNPTTNQHYSLAEKTLIQLPDTLSETLITHGIEGGVEIKLDEPFNKIVIVNNDGTTTTNTVDPFSVYDYISENPQVVVYTESEDDITVSTTTEPFSLYDEFGDEVEVLFYTDDDTVTDADLILEANWSPIDELEGNFEVVTWTDETDSTRTLELNGLPSPKFIAKGTLNDIKGTLSGLILNDSSTFITSSNVRFLLTNNNSTWYRWNGTNFESVTYSKVKDILTLGNTYDELVNADYSKWTHSKINIGVFLKDDDNTTSKVNELGIITNSPIRTSQVSNLNFYLLNTTAKIDLDLKGLWLSGQLSDLDLTRVQYRVFLNGQPYYPLSGQFTNLDNPPLNIDITFKSEEIKINDWNTLRVEFMDFFGTVDYWQTTFVGNYSSLMFMDTDGNYYSDDVGKVLQYLDFGTFFGGQYTLEHEVVVKNQYGYDVNNLTIEASTGSLPEGVEVQFSDTSDPFTPQSSLFLPNELKNDEQVSFYIRMISDIDSVPNGENKFNIFVKAERKV